jgi:hypothetical protein
MGVIGHPNPSHTALRLVEAPDPAAGPTWADRQRVRQANADAAGLSPSDARTILAARAGEALEGGRAAILRPERRARLLDLSARMGLRPFDASMIIAIVQDAARHDEPLDHEQTTGRLRLVRPPTRDRVPLYAALAATLLALATTAALIAWILAG